MATEKRKIHIPSRRKRKITSRQYNIYLEEEQWAGLPATLYEKLCNFAQTILKIEPDEKSRKNLQEVIDFIHIHVTPVGVSSLAILTAFSICFPTLLLIVLNLLRLPGLTIGVGLLIMGLSLPLVYFLYFYPMHLKKRYETRMGSSIINMILYMTIYLRDNPNMEGAINFAANNLTGQLAYELRKLIWDVEIGKYPSMDEAVIQFGKRWSSEKDFIESLEIMRNSLHRTEEHRKQMLDEAVNLILDTTMNKSKKYNRNLKLPIMIINAMGMILPIMGLVLFPVIAIFLGVHPVTLFIGYDVILPLVLFFVVTKILEIRPSTLGTIKIKKGESAKLGVGKHAVPVSFLSLIPLIIFIIAGMILYSNNGLLGSVLIIMGPGLGMMVYFLMNSESKMKLREKVRSIEKEFAEALFQLGNQVSGGTPLEMGLERSLHRIGDLSIKDMFKKASINMRQWGMTFEQSFFDQDKGAIRPYPSKLIRSIMKTIIKASEKGVEVAAIAMLNISRYLKNIYKTQKQVEEEMSDTLSSLKFQAFFLSPIICGIIVTMAVIIINVLEQVGESMATVGGGAGAPMLNLLGSWGTINISPGQFQLVVGIYMLESSLLLGYFINGVENGEDPIGRENLTGSILLFGIIVYVMALFISYMIFQPLISGFTM